MKRTLQLIGIVLLVALGVLSAFLLNTYLANTNRFIYATGTKDKAFLNATWKMSRQEIQRANNTSLSASENELTFLFAPHVMNQNRFKEYVQKDVHLWGHATQIEFSFFDNMLYEYYIPITAYHKEDPYQEIVKTLQEQFGSGKQVRELREDVISSFEWDSGTQTISCWMIKNDDPKDSYHIGIRVTYIPFYNQIKEIAKVEKKTYF